MRCDLAASSLNWFVRHFVPFVVVGILFHVGPPLAVSAMVRFECEVPVVSIPMCGGSVVVSHHFFNCQVYQVRCVCFSTKAVYVDGRGLVV